MPLPFGFIPDRTVPIKNLILKKKFFFRVVVVLQNIINRAVDCTVMEKNC